MQTLAHRERRSYQRRFASQQRQEWSDLVSMRQHVVDREDGAWMQDANRVRPPTRILDPLRIEEEQIDATVGESGQISTALLLPQLDPLGEAGLNRVGA